MTTDEIRRSFLEFFRSRSHELVPSASLVPKDDPTLLFTGAGMNQFKEKFLGRNITYRRATTCQKCLRTADLENVGRTSGHHTFFEMLGNFSFGGYFKKEAIEWAWEFLTKDLKIKARDLWVSVYKEDDEAYGIWKDLIKVPKERIMKFGSKENFWPSEAPEKGPNGPCGPCSEIFYDYGEGVGCRKPGCTPACDCGRFVEVWNLVFTQFDRQPDGALKPLPNRNIDTGMGLERLASVMQGVKTNFEIDIFKPIVDAIKREISYKLQVMSYELRVNAIADHIRAVTFAIADGVMPSNEERGYVVRKLIRRARIHAATIGIEKPFLYALSGIAVDVMKAQYPELVKRREEIAQVVKREEESFSNMLTTVLPKVKEALEGFSSKKDKGALEGLIFNFYDTYGVPYDLLEEYTEKFKLEIDKKEFEKLMDRQRALSRSKTKIKSDIFSEDEFTRKVKGLAYKTEFLGYEEGALKAKVLAVMEGGEVILDRTPFYGESGGQVGDWGTIETDSGKMKVEDARKIGETIVHLGTLLSGRISKGEIARVAIDKGARDRVMRNHTATHLLQAALRKVLGEHVHQTGSMVDSERLRFDFTHPKKVDEREIARIEDIVNENIREGIHVKKEIMDLESAKASGAIALFGEKYDKRVRVVSVEGISKELCGGTHVNSTAEIGVFKITSESSIAAGMRRIEALTDKAAMDFMRKELDRLAMDYAARVDKIKKTDPGSGVKDALKKGPPGEITINAYRKYREDMLSAIGSVEGMSIKIEKAMEAKRLEEVVKEVDMIISGARSIGGVSVISKEISRANPNILRHMADAISSKVDPALVVLGSSYEGKVFLVASLTKGLAQAGELKAGDVIKKIAIIVGGSGGGRSDFAQAGGKDPSKLNEALEKVFEIAKEELER